MPHERILIDETLLVNEGVNAVLRQVLTSANLVGDSVILAGSVRCGNIRQRKSSTKDSSVEVASYFIALQECTHIHEAWLHGINDTNTVTAKQLNSKQRVRCAKDVATPRSCHRL